MDTLTIATSAADSAAVEAITQHHAELLGAAAARVNALTSAAARRDQSAADAARLELVAWARTELLPHAAAEEATLYAAARELDGGRLLVDSMIAAHQVLADLVVNLHGVADPVLATGFGVALGVSLELHVWQENELVLPLVAAAPNVSLANLLEQMHTALEHVAMAGGGCGCGGGGCGCGGGGCGCGGHDEVEESPAPAGHAGACGCGGHDDPAEMPVLDAREVPHAIRHATVFGALDAVAPGRGMVLVAPHDPLPLLAQIEQRHPGVFAVSYLERGPEAWRLAFERLN